MTETKSSEEEQHASRCAFVSQLLQGWGLEVTTIVPVERIKNNQMYHITLLITLSQPLNDQFDIKMNQPGTSPIPAGTKQLIFRVPRVGVPFNQSIRVQNYVAAAELARNALKSKGLPASIVPRVYAWSTSGPDPDGVGWILEEHMPGIGNAEFLFYTWTPEIQKRVLHQMADILAAIQQLELPDTVTGYGSLGYNEKGDIINVPLIVEPFTGPYNSFSEYFTDRLEISLKDAERSLLVNGWHGNIRPRIDKFVKGRFSEMLKKVTTNGSKRVLIIGDMSTQLLSWPLMTC